MPFSVEYIKQTQVCISCSVFHFLLQQLTIIAGIAMGPNKNAEPGLENSQNLSALIPLQQELVRRGGRGEVLSTSSTASHITFFKQLEE